MSSRNPLRWLKSFSTAAPYRRPRRRPSVRLTLEALEARLAPAAFIVNDAGDGAGSAADVTLRFALANLDVGSAATTNSITFDRTVFAKQQTITQTSGLTITQGVAITGPAAGVVIDGSRFNGIGVDADVTVSLSGLTITDGNGVFNQGTLTVTGCTFSNNNSNHPGVRFY